ncbi:hydroxyethylthiazole kinase [Acetobacteraceae bacterium H6797]|nr:hydroxyethylthiazole kinase [Acetobacteraceae bacterium H6797]
MPPLDLLMAVSRLRASAPLVHNITNFVVSNITANALLAIGASPAMVQAEEEVEEFVRKASSLVVNIGTLLAPQRRAMHLAARAAGEAGKPWILDPVAIGATTWRRETALSLLTLRPAVVRGNASEIMALAGEGGISRGVDSTQASEAGLDAARRLASRSGAVVAMTGAVDYVTDGERVLAIANGHPMLTRVTGTGCTATAIVGAFLGAGLPSLDAAGSGLALLGLAAERAVTGAAGPGSFQVALLDALHAIDGEALAAGARMHWA